VILASALCAVPISLGVDLIGVPFGFLVHTIFLNNLLVTLVLVPLLIRALGTRIRGMKLTYEQVLQPQEISRSVKIGPVIVFALTLVIYAFMMVPSLHEAIPLRKDLFQIACGLILFLSTIFLV